MINEMTNQQMTTNEKQNTSKSRNQFGFAYQFEM